MYLINDGKKNNIRAFSLFRRRGHLSAFDHERHLAAYQVCFNVGAGQCLWQWYQLGPFFFFLAFVSTAVKTGWNWNGCRILPTKGFFIKQTHRNPYRYREICFLNPFLAYGLVFLCLCKHQRSTNCIPAVTSYPVMGR